MVETEKIKIFTEYKMRLIKNIKKRENRQILLKEGGFKSIQDARKALGMKNEKADVVYQQLMEHYNEQLDEIRKNQQKTKQKAKRTELANIKKKEFTIIKQNSISIQQPSLKELKNFLQPYKEQGNVLITVVSRGKVIHSAEINLNQSNTNLRLALFNEFYYGDKEFLGGAQKHQGDDDLNTIKQIEEWNNRKAVISFNVDIQPKKIAQAFKQGITNCLFTPIIEWATKKQTEAKTEKTAYNYGQRIEKLKRLEEKYRENGVNENELQDIANEIQMDLIIDQPFQQKFIEKKSDKKPLTKFHFINTKLDHIDLNQIVNKEPEYITHEELNDKYNLLYDSDIYFTFTRNISGISSISTLQNTFRIKQDFQEFVNEFEKETGLDGCYLDDFKEVELSKFVRQGTHLNATIDFVDVDKVREFDDKDNNVDNDDKAPIDFSTLTSDQKREFIEQRNKEYDNKLNTEETHQEKTIKLPTTYKHIDQQKSYINYELCKYYEGFLGKITDFRPTDKMVTDLSGNSLPGLYRIKNLKFVGKLKQINDTMNIYNDNIFPTPDLKFILNNGGTFDIIEGCWGSRIEFSMDNEAWLRKDENIKYYCKWVGSKMAFNDKNSFYIKGSESYIQNMLSIIDYDSYKYFGGEILQINYNKTYNTHLSHIASFITAYTRLNTLEQLMSIPYDNLIRVCVDGIYLYGDYELKNCFVDKPEHIKNNIAGETFISNYEVEYSTLCDAEFRDHYMKEMHAGCGGSGKTHMNLKDKGLIKSVFIAPSWCLAREKQKEFGIDCQVHHRLLSDDPTKWGLIAKNYNVIFIDECTLISESQKQIIFDRYPNIKIIFLGDPGYQLDGFSVDKNVKFIPFTTEKFENIVLYDKNYRVKCNVLAEHLINIRNLIKNKKNNCVQQYVLDNFNTIDEITDYKVEDMILARTHVIKDAYTEKYAHLEKYYIETTDRNYYKGEIVIGQKPSNGVIRHCYTVHSTIGRTAEHNLYIDINGMINAQVLYTAISRPRRFNQIFLVNNQI
tara:strand:+ start:1959 stop:5003 length:3045 start_codon:yes stop_codon:yes gene_type:complete